MGRSNVSVVDGENGTAAKASARKGRITELTIPAPNFQVAEFLIRGTAPLVMNKFSTRKKRQIHDAQEAGSTAKKNTKRDAKNFKREYEESIHRDKAGWAGIPAPAFRNAMISACRAVGFQMTKAKISVFAMSDGTDVDDGTPLVKITKGKPKYAEHSVRNDSGVCDLRPRAMWGPGWEAKVRVRFDADQFTLQDVANLMARAGVQVGIGEGRPDSRKSNGMGWGLFDVTQR